MPQTIKQIKSRITSIKNTKKLTNAMELISKTKYQLSFKKLPYSREYLLNIENFLSRLFEELNLQKFIKDFDSEKIILIVFSSDNGFCSKYNTEILKNIKDFIKDKKTENIDLYLIGKKLQNSLFNVGLSCKKLYIGYLGKFSKDIISDLVNNIKNYSKKNIYIVYTKFYSSVKQETTVENLFSSFLKKIEQKNISDESEYIKELKIDNCFFDKIVNLFLFAKLQNVFLESLVSEHTNRMLSMRTANDNAKHILEKLVLSLNKMRQALITGELIEIISSSDAVKNS